MAEEFDNDSWKNLVKLAEGNISGNSVTNNDVAKALDPICSQVVYSEYIDTALKYVDFAVVLKVKSWLDWYVLHQEFDSYSFLKTSAKVASAVQLAFLSVVFALMFLYDSTIPSYVTYDAKVVFSIIGLVIFSIVSDIFSTYLNQIKKEIEVARLFLSSINKFLTNQRERK